MNISRTNVLIGIVVFLALTIRLYNIYDTAIFKGDQGRDAIILLEHFQNGTIPLTGPRTSTGQFPGPFFFYIIGVPLVFSKFDPLAPTVFITVLEALTVIPLFLLVRKFADEKVAACTALIYALSPHMISQSRLFWNPTSVPFFTAFLFLCMYEYVKKPRDTLLFSIGIILGIIVQLHASTYLYLPVATFTIGYLLVRKSAKNNRKKIGRSIAHYILGIILPLLPYIGYEMTHSFSDIQGLLNVGLRAGTIVGSTIPAHYFSFVAVVPFIAIGILLAVINKHAGTRVAIGISAIAIVINIIRLPYILTSTHDLAKTTWAVATIANASEEKPFAFVQVSGASASDLHYRFLFMKDNISVESYESNDYKTLFIICDSATCQTDDQFSRSRIQAMCFEKYCDREYPYIELTKWKFIQSMNGDTITIYQFERS